MNKNKNLAEMSPDEVHDEVVQEIMLKPGDIFATLLGYLLLIGPLFYFFVWKQLPLQGTAKIIVNVAIATALVAVSVVLIIKKRTVLEHIRNLFVVLFIVLGAAIFSIYFTAESRSLMFKLFIIGYFSFLPAWLYLQFLSVKSKTLWDEYILNLYRLHIDHFAYLPEPPKHSLFYKVWRKAYQTEKSRENVEFDQSVYEKKFMGLFGPISTGERFAFSVFRGENLWPVAIATLIISVGWVMVVEPATLFNISLVPNSFEPTGSPLIPQESFRFAFLGSYFYVLQMLVRRYFQSDLKTTAYVNATMRFIVVFLLTWVATILLGNTLAREQILALAFVIGVFPHIGWEAIIAAIKLPLRKLIPSLQQKYPLSDLDGLNIWYESRLLEEGIEDMQNLATANLVDVMLNTRIPVERLVDWIDQSLLYLHLGTSEAPNGETNREVLRRFGIRTATDLEDAFRSKDAELVKKLEYLLNQNEQEPSILRLVQATMQNEPNLYHIEKWRSYAERYLETEAPPAGPGNNARKTRVSEKKVSA